MVSPTSQEKPATACMVQKKKKQMQWLWNKYDYGILSLQKYSTSHFEISSPYWWHDRGLVFAEYRAESTNKRELGAGEVFAQRRYRKSSVFASTDVPKGQNQRN